MDSIEKLAKLFSEFPGIGERQSKRFVYYILHRGGGYADTLAHALGALKGNISQCPSCFVFFESNGKKFCPLCENPATVRETLLVVEKDADYESMKRSHLYKGLMFVVGGTITIADKEAGKRIRIRELKKRVEEEMKKGALKEVILAFSLTPNGNFTDEFVRQELRQFSESGALKISSLGRGLSTGTEIEYSDSETIKNALRNRQ